MNITLYTVTHTNVVIMLNGYQNS